jgi:transcriptional regulator with XRE-family HTH domain
MHKLTKFRHTEDLTMLQTAELLGVSEGIISYWESGRRTPRLYHIRKIEKLTDGVVTADDWEPQSETAS